MLKIFKRTWMEWSNNTIIKRLTALGVVGGVSYGAKRLYRRFDEEVNDFNQALEERRLELETAQALREVAQCREMVSRNIRKTVLGVSGILAVSYSVYLFKDRIDEALEGVGYYIQEGMKEEEIKEEQPLSRIDAVKNAFASMHNGDWRSMVDLQNDQVGFVSLQFRLQGDWSEHVMTLHCRKQGGEIILGQIVFDNPQGGMEIFDHGEVFTQLRDYFFNSLKKFQVQKIDSAD